MIERTIISGRRGLHGPRKSLPVHQWPERDQGAWNAARKRGDIFDGNGSAARWSEKYAGNVAYAYGRWLAWLVRVDSGALALAPGDRINAERIRRYLDEMEKEIESTAAGQYLLTLHAALGAIESDRDWAWLRDVGRRVGRGGSTRHKRPRMVSASRLLELGLGLMGDAKALVTKRAIERHQQHRDGLVIALLACRPLRRANLAGIRIGRQLQRIGTTWVLLFQPHKTKARQPIEVFLPEFLTPYIDHYIKYVRPAFPRSDSHDGLWASSKGCPMSDGALYDAVMRRTRTAFGHGINPHLFRDIAATTVATLAPEQVLIAKDLLGHARFETTERFYNQAYSLDASRSYQHVVAELREAARREHPGRWHRIALHATVEETP